MITKCPQSLRPTKTDDESAALLSVLHPELRDNGAAIISKSLTFWLASHTPAEINKARRKIEQQAAEVTNAN